MVAPPAATDSGAAPTASGSALDGTVIVMDLVLDNSGSMARDNLAGFPARGSRWAAVQSAANALLGTLTQNDYVSVLFGFRW